MKLNLFSGGSLYPYQIYGCKWIVSLFEHGLNGILADEMGLGKTIEVIGFFCHVIESGIEGPFLVVVPLSIIPYWMHELKRFSPKLPHIFYYGCDRYKQLLDFKLQTIEISDNTNVQSYPIILTSYEIARRDKPIFDSINFKAIIVDEGHRLKNCNSKMLYSMKEYKSDLRLILTGTPLQNNLSELWCLLYYVMPDIFTYVESFEDFFHSTSSLNLFQEEVLYEEKERALITTIHKIISPFILRRLKSEVQLSVPPKREIILSTLMVEEQRSLYNKIINGDINFDKLFQFNQFILKDDSQSIAVRVKGNVRAKSPNYSCLKYAEFIENFLNLFGSDSDKTHHTASINFQNRNMSILLRKLINHPYMIYYPLDNLGQFDINEKIIEFSGKMRILDNLLVKLKIGNHKVLIFSQFNNMLDILQDYMNYKNWKYSRLDGTMSVEDRSDQIDWFVMESNIFCFLLNTKTGGLGLNLSAADTVIIYDGDWNPQCDIQAQDRCHRIGQSTPVLVFRLVVKDTVDQYLIDNAQVKRNFEKTILHQRKFKGDFFDQNNVTDCNDFNRQNYNNKVFSFNCMSKDEMTDILSSRVDEIFIDVAKITDEQIEKLLDRSDLYKQWNKT